VPFVRASAKKQRTISQKKKTSRKGIGKKTLRAGGTERIQKETPLQRGGKNCEGKGIWRSYKSHCQEKKISSPILGKDERSAHERGEILKEDSGGFEKGRKDYTLWGKGTIPRLLGGSGHKWKGEGASIF